jgi:hypothetical protein
LADIGCNKERLCFIIKIIVALDGIQFLFYFYRAASHISFMSRFKTGDMIFKKSDKIYQH